MHSKYTRPECTNAATDFNGNVIELILGTEPTTKWQREKRSSSGEQQTNNPTSTRGNTQRGRDSPCSKWHSTSSIALHEPRKTRGEHGAPSGRGSAPATFSSLAVADVADDQPAYRPHQERAHQVPRVYLPPMSTVPSSYGAKNTVAMTSLKNPKSEKSYHSGTSSMTPAAVCSVMPAAARGASASGARAAVRPAGVSSCRSAPSCPIDSC